jgi:hypothetical protein
MKQNPKNMMCVCRTLIASRSASNRKNIRLLSHKEQNPTKSNRD